MVHDQLKQECQMIALSKPKMSGLEMSAFRNFCKMDHKEFAALLGVTPQAVQLWETEQRRIPETTVRLIEMFKKYPETLERF